MGRKPALAIAGGPARPGPGLYSAQIFFTGQTNPRNSARPRPSAAAGRLLEPGFDCWRTRGRAKCRAGAGALYVARLRLARLPFYTGTSRRGQWPRLLAFGNGN